VGKEEDEGWRTVNGRAKRRIDFISEILAVGIQ
jgi:hypothetical protein